MIENWFFRFKKQFFDHLDFLAMDHLFTNQFQAADVQEGLIKNMICGCNSLFSEYILCLPYMPVSDNVRLNTKTWNVEIKFLKQN